MTHIKYIKIHTIVCVLVVTKVETKLLSNMHKSIIQKLFIYKSVSKYIKYQVKYYVTNSKNCHQLLLGGESGYKAGLDWNFMISPKAFKRPSEEKFGCFDAIIRYLLCCFLVFVNFFDERTEIFNMGFHQVRSQEICFLSILISYSVFFYWEIM